MISHIENGNTTLPVRHIESLAEELGIPVDKLVDGLVEDFRNSVYRQIEEI